MNAELLEETARRMVSRVILAADESSPTIARSFKSVGLEANPALNCEYRELLFTAPGLGDFVSGVILYDETIRQQANDGTPFAQLLAQRGIVPGVKVDKGLVLLPGKAPDNFTQGLDGLGGRLREYREMGAGFAKWRALFTIADAVHPTNVAIERNAHDLALYAAICQEEGLVPIVEPEVLMEGGHSLADCVRVTRRVLTAVFGRLDDYGVFLPGIVLKPNMITAGSRADVQADPEEVARVTLAVLRDSVSPKVPGIAFLSGGQSPDLATGHLNELNILRKQLSSEFPWRLTASFGRALQREALNVWRGEPENVVNAQNALLGRAEKVHRASLGQL